MATETVTIVSNATLAKLHNPSREAKLAAMAVLSYKVAGAEDVTAFKQGKWDGRSTFFDFSSGTFPAGFTVYLGAALKKRGFDIKLVRRPLPAPLGPEKPVVDAFPEDPRYDYQPETLERVLRHGNMIAQIATGGGKSRIVKLVYARIARPTLFLTTRSLLMYQMRDAFEKDMGVQCSVLGDGQFGEVRADGRQFIKRMTVGMVQTLISRLELPDPRQPPEKQEAQARVRQQTIDLLSKFEVVIGEEAHEAAGNGYFEILKHCKNASYRLALTATPFMKDDEEANMRLMASFGSIGIRVSEKMLIDRGILAKPHFKIIGLKTPPVNLRRKTAWQAAYRLGIVTNPERNTAIVNEAREGAHHGLTSMILIQQKAHGSALQQELEKAGLRVRFIQGEDDQDERKRALDALGRGDIDSLIGTTILDVGVDVPAVGMIVLAGGGKAQVALRQRIGRGLRAKKRGPNAALVVDFDDPFNFYTKDHAAQRLSIIQATPGFAENVLPAGKPFDYSGLGFARVC